MAVSWENVKDYDVTFLGGLKYYTVSVLDGDGNPVAIVYGRTRQECAERADAVANVPQFLRAEEVRDGIT